MDVASPARARTDDRPIAATGSADSFATNELATKFAAADGASADGPRGPGRPRAPGEGATP